MLRVLSIILLLTLPSLASYERITRDNGNLFFSLDTIQLYRFNDKEMKLLVFDAAQGDIESTLKQHNCVAGINGGYFGGDTARSPLGIMRHDGKTIAGRIQQGRFTVSGILYDSGEGIHLLRSKRMQQPMSKMKEALQAGPFLLEHSKKIKGLSRQGKASRSFIATDGQGNWCIAVSSPLTLDELAEWLLSKDFQSRFPAQTALNLDGGSSSFFYTASPQRFLPPSRKLRSFIGIAPRSTH